uniref:Alpha-conotoxin-like Ai1.1 n=2 Tax=Conus ammiralis TaxID=97188 RepID=CA11_CONAJ|nr:RecName: Full=Alpha-conotoxin-like Ai1.1; Flags: Precursor [Conus ammiralis]P0CB12.1 RecName: Full=Alpha-conotoxin-like 289; Flags: Precursor [Conus ammiralis]
MFTVFLLVVLATTVVSFTSDRAFRGRNAAAKASGLVGLTDKRQECCSYPACNLDHPELCG